MNMTRAMHIRQAAIIELVENWIASEEDCLGQLVNDGGFANLYADVSDLRKLGRSADWKNAIDKWLATIDYARKTFADTNGYSVAVDLGGIKNFTHTTGIDFARMIKWAILQGSIYASNI